MSGQREPWMMDPVRERDLPPLVRRLRWPLVPTAIVLSLLSWLTTPLPASFAAYLRDDAAGQVAQVSRDCRAHTELGLRIGVQNPATGRRPDLCWTTETGLTYAADLNDRRAARLDLDGSALSSRTVHDISNLLALVLLLGLLIGLVNGPQPRRLTKWGTFWFLLIPGGLGVAWLLGNEAPWDRKLLLLPAPPPRWRGRMGGALVRHGGWTGFVGLLIAAFLLGLVSSAARAALSPADDGTLLRGGAGSISAGHLAQRQVVDEHAPFLRAGPLLHVGQIDRPRTGDRAVGA